MPSLQQGLGATLMVFLVAFITTLWMWEWWRRVVTQRALQRACRLARISKAWDPRPPDADFLQRLRECETLAGHVTKKEGRA